MTPYLPEPAHGQDETHRVLFGRRPAVVQERGAQRGAYVVVLPLELPEPVRLVGAAQFRFADADEFTVGAQMP